MAIITEEAEPIDLSMLSPGQLEVELAFALACADAAWPASLTYLARVEAEITCR